MLGAALADDDVTGVKDIFKSNLFPQKLGVVTDMHAMF
jgi:hypothetical protein